MNKKSVKDIDVKGKRVLVRCDFNVPLDNGRITDENRIVGAMPTIKYLMENEAKTILCSHLGRPKNGFEPKVSLKPVADRLSELLGLKVELASDVIGADAKSKVASLKEGGVVMLENVRCHPEEEKNDKAFSKALSEHCDIYVNDAFGTAHRAHSSTAGVSEFVKTSVAGFLIEKELEIMGGALSEPKRPFVAVLGGAKVSDKIGVIKNLLNKVDSLLIGGAMAYTFCAANGGKVGGSRVERDKIDLAKELLALAKKNKVDMLLPLDNLATTGFNFDAKTYGEVKIFYAGKIEDGWEGLDIGPQTIKKYQEVISKAKTVIWNGPMGVFEIPAFATGTKSIAEALASSGAISIIGGGDSAAAVIQMGFEDKITHISTGGGASLEFMEGLVLPGIACLNDK